MASSTTELSWQTIVGALTAVALLAAAQWAIFQTQFANVEKSATNDRTHIEELSGQLDKYLTIREHSEYRAATAAQLDDMRQRVATLETARVAILDRLAHDPVENATFQAVAKATDDRVNLIQSQINDINRQIAAALIIIDNNSGATRKTAPILPP